MCIKKGYQLISTIIAQFIVDGCMYRAASLAFTSLLSLVPLLTVSFSIFSAFPVFKGLGQVVQDFVFKNFVASSATIVQQHIESFIAHTAQLSISGLIFLIITALLMIFNMELAFNDIWRIKKRRSGISAFLLYWAVLTLTPLLLGVALLVGSYLMSFSHMLPMAGHVGFDHGIWMLVPWFSTWAGFTLLYLTLPNCKVPLLPAALGGFFALILFQAAKWGFALYLAYFPSYQLLYGALATVPIFLFWVYLSWLVILFGGVVSHVVGTQGRKR
jgi:membrane protein